MKPQTQPETHLLTHGAHAHQASTGPTSFVPAMSTRRVREAGHSGRWAFFDSTNMCHVQLIKFRACACTQKQLGLRAHSWRRPLLETPSALHAHRRRALPGGTCLNWTGGGQWRRRQHFLRQIAHGREVACLKLATELRRHRCAVVALHGHFEDFFEPLLQLQFRADLRGGSAARSQRVRNGTLSSSFKKKGGLGWAKCF